MKVKDFEKYPCTKHTACQMQNSTVEFSEISKTRLFYRFFGYLIEFLKFQKIPSWNFASDMLYVLYMASSQSPLLSFMTLSDEICNYTFAQVTLSAPESPPGSTFDGRIWVLNY